VDRQVACNRFEQGRVTLGRFTSEPAKARFAVCECSLRSGGHMEYHDVFGSKANNFSLMDYKLQLIGLHRLRRTAFSYQFHQISTITRLFAPVLPGA
jgi:hypothetical protein